MSQTILIKQQWTTKDKLKALEAGGKKRNRVAGGWIADLAAQKGAITLCGPCTPKFNPARVGYRKEKEFPAVRAKCDGCSTDDLFCTLYIYEAIYSQVRSTVEERRALAKSREKRIQRGYL